VSTEWVQIPGRKPADAYAGSIKDGYDNSGATGATYEIPAEETAFCARGTYCVGGAPTNCPEGYYCGDQGLSANAGDGHQSLVDGSPDHRG
jgi:hypothetical protein